MNCQHVVIVIAVSSLGCKNSGGESKLVAPTICQLTHNAQAIVACQFATVGQRQALSQANVAGVAGFLNVSNGDDPPSSVNAVTLSISHLILGSLSGTLAAFASTSDVSGGALAGPNYADGTFSSGYCFLARDNDQWVLESQGFFRQDEQDASLVRNSGGGLYSGGIATQEFLSEVQASLAAPCPPVKPGPCKQGFEGCQLICDLVDADSCPTGQQCQPCPTGGAICYMTCVPDGGSCPPGEYCAVSNQGGYVCAVSEGTACRQNIDCPGGLTCAFDAGTSAAGACE